MRNWKITYDKYCKAVDKLYNAVSPHLEYNMVCDDIYDEQVNNIFISVDKNVQGFSINVDKCHEKKQNITITAQDEIFLLYAVSDFKNKYLPYAANLHDRAPRHYFSKLFYDPMKEYSITSTPRIKERGIWTWGYVIYDYKKFIDNMVTLKLNTLIIWNDYLPVNINEVISYAHENGVKIYLGFAWGWDTSKDIGANITKTDEVYEHVINTYNSEYKQLGCDGIYFQSFTEVEEDNIGGISVAETVVEMVNKISAKLFDENKDLKLLFGLHATSVKNKLDIIKKADSRISIIWEDAGAFPYDYMPSKIDGFEETKKFTSEIQNLRDGGFGVVLKGVACLDWMNFEHQKGKFLLGMTDEKSLKKIADSKRNILKYVQAYWIKNASYAHEMIKEFNEDAMITVLCEDCAFEEIINYPMALYAEMMWDSDKTTDEIMCMTALMPDVEMV